MEYAIEIEGLKKTYSDTVKALKGIDLKIPKGDFMALLGPNGAGKSTMIGVLCSLVRKTAGTAKINGYDIDKDAVLAKQNIGVVTQEDNFNIFKQVQNILIDQAGYYGIPYKEAEKRSEKYLKILQLWDKRKEIAHHLSGGMKKRLMVAKALMHEPDILILDEPSAGVDVEIRRSIWDFLIELNSKGKTIILTTHYLEEAETLCNRLAVINDGKIIEYGKMREVLDKLEHQKIIFETNEPVKKSVKLPFKYEKVEQNTYEITINKENTFDSVVRALVKAKITVTNIKSKSNRLEELFLHLIRK